MTHGIDDMSATDPPHSTPPGGPPPSPVPPPLPVPLPPPLPVRPGEPVPTAPMPAFAPIRLEYADPAPVTYQFGPRTYIRSFPCPECSGRISARSDLEGKAMICPNCGKSVVVPPPAPTPLGDRASQVLLARAACPACALPLAGLADNLCPRCGRRFDLQGLVARPRARSAWAQVLTILGGLLLVFLFLFCFASTLVR